MKVSKKLKGFTLLELIIVIALFTIIMAAVMTLIDPVSKVMSKASIQEKNSSSVNRFSISVRKSAASFA